MNKAKTPRDARELSRLTHLIYEAGVQPERWNNVVSEISDSFGTTKGLLFTPYVAPQHGGLIFPTGISEQTLQLWASSYIDHDIWAKGLNTKALWGDGNVWLDEEMCPREEFVQSRFYRDFLSRIGIGRVCLGLIFGGAPGLPPTSLSIFRDLGEPAFDESDREWMRLLVSHVSRSLGVMQRLDTARLQQTSLLASFDRLHFGVALLNGEMQVLHLNTAARCVIDRRDGISINARNQLESGRDANAPRALARWLTDIRDTPLSDQAHFVDGCRVPRTGDKQHYVVQCSAVSEAGKWTSQDEVVRYVAFIIDPNAIRLPSAERLMSLYGLTKTQAKVAIEIAGGGTYRQAARRMHVTDETVRSHVKEIYAKCRISRQADLVRLVLSLAQSAV